MGGVKKEYLPFQSLVENEKSLTVLGAAVKAFISCPEIDLIVIVAPAGSEKEINEARASLPADFTANRAHIFFVHGGPTRRASVHNGLLFLESHKPSHVLIHDGARPWIKQELIEKVIRAMIQYSAVIPALPMIETPKELKSQLVSGDRPVSDTADNFIQRHLKRTTICTAQTPQGFKFPEILMAHEKAATREEAGQKAGEQIEYTDDAEIWGEFIGKVAVVPGDPENRKITYPGDLAKIKITNSE